MSGASKIGTGTLGLAVSIDTQQVAAETDRAGLLISSGITKRLNGGQAADTYIDSFNQRLVGVKIDPERHFQKKLDSLLTSVERNNFGESVVRRAGQLIKDMTGAVSSELLRAAQNLEAVLLRARVQPSSATLPPTGTSLHPAGAFGKDPTYLNPNFTSEAFADKNRYQAVLQHSERLNDQTQLEKQLEKDHRRQWDRDLRKEKERRVQEENDRYQYALLAQEPAQLRVESGREALRLEDAEDKNLRHQAQWALRQKELAAQSHSQNMAAAIAAVHGGTTPNPYLQMLSGGPMSAAQRAQKAAEERQAQSADNFTLSGVSSPVLSAVQRDRIEAQKRADAAAGLNLLRSGVSYEGDASGLIGPEQDLAAAKTARLRRLAGQSGAHITTGSPFEDQALGGVIRSNINQNASEDAREVVKTQGLQVKELISSLKRESLPSEHRQAVERARTEAAADIRSRSAQAEYEVYRMNNPEQTLNRAGINKSDSHKFRFASQNLAFGIDDAIQSYHYGGIGASIRAASNNATAIAGMAISNPTTAAASVIAISIASAIAPALIKLAQGGANPRPVLNEQRLYDIETSSRGGYNLLSQKGEGRGLFSKSQSDILEADVNSKALQEESAFLRNQWKIKAREFAGDVQGSSTVGQWGHALNWMVGAGPTAELDALKTKQNDTVQKQMEERKKRSLAEARYEESLRVSAEERSIGLIGTQQNRLITAGLAQGNFASGGELGGQIQADFKKRMDQVRKGSGSQAGKRFRLEALNEEMKDQLADPENRDRLVRDSQIRARASGRNFTTSMSGETGRVGGLLSSIQNQFDTLAVSRNNSELSQAEYSRRVQLTQQNWQRNRERSVEDDLEELNPERNPLKRQETQLRRISEDLKLRQGLSVGEKTDQARAALIAGERRLAEYSQSGQRNFISRSTVGSIEDEELKARMTGNFGPQQKREDHMDENLAQINEKFAKLIEMVHIKAVELGH